MHKKIIEIESCFECPYSCWNEDYKNFECSKKGQKIIDDIEVIPVWCPLKDA